MARLVGQCVEAGILVDASEPSARFAPDRNRARYLSLKATLVPRGSVARVTRWLTWLYTPIVVALLLPLCVAAQMFFAALVATTAPIDLDLLTGADVVAVLLASSLLGLVHELGHATALARYGYPTASIGWGMYLTMAVFYTDLSDAWRLRRTQRAVVDSGGLYFQGVGVAALIALAALEPSPLLLCTIWFANLQMLSSLNPLFRMDGYWFLADLYGVSSLRAYASDTLEGWVRALLGLKRRRVESSPLPRATRTFIFLYSIASSVFFIVAAGLMAERLVASLAPSVARGASEVWRLSAAGRFASWDTAATVGALSWRVLALVGLGVFVTRALRSLARVVRRLAIDVGNPSTAERQAA